jgi:hypothetical protein
MIASLSVSNVSTKLRAQMVGSPAPIVCFTWSRRKLQIAAVALLMTAVPATVVAIAEFESIAKLLCLTWLLAAAYFAHGIGRRASSRTVVLLVDERGILDLRLMRKRMGTTQASFDDIITWRWFALSDASRPFGSTMR